MEIDKDRKIETDEEVGLDDDDDDKIKSETRGLDNMIEDPDKITNL
jgi:hypothetical protein